MHEIGARRAGGDPLRERERIRKVLEFLTGHKDNKVNNMQMFSERKSLAVNSNLIPVPTPAPIPVLMTLPYAPIARWL